MDSIFNFIATLFIQAFTVHPWQTGFFTVIILLVSYLLFGNRFIKKMQITSIDYHIVKEQMKFSEEKADLIEDSLTRLYLKMRKDARGTKIGLMKDDEVQHFQLMLKYLKKKSLKYLRHSFRENHLAERENYEQWIDQRSEEILRNLRELLNAWFPSKSDPGLEHFYDRYVVEKRPEVKDALKSSLREAREITLRFKKRKYVKNYIKMISG